MVDQALLLLQGVEGYSRYHLVLELPSAMSQRDHRPPVRPGENVNLNTDWSLSYIIMKLLRLPTQRERQKAKDEKRSFLVGGH